MGGGGSEIVMTGNCKLKSTWKYQEYLKEEIAYQIKQMVWLAVYLIQKNVWLRSSIIS